MALSLQIFLKKYKMTNTTLVLIYFARHQLAIITLFIHPEGSIVDVEKRLFEFLECPSISISKKVAIKIFGNVPVKHVFWSP